MAERLEGSGVCAQLVSAVVEGVPNDALFENLDRLLRWIAAPDAPGAAPIDAELRRRQIESGAGRQMGLLLLEESLFAGHRGDPRRTLGLGRDATPGDVRRRYHLLMRIYHPDLAGRASAWLTERAERINEAYARIQEAGAAAGRAAREAPSAAGPERRLRARPRRRRASSHSFARRLRRRLGDSRAVRRRVLAGVVLVCSALVVHTCVAHRAWRGWSGPGGSAAALRSETALSWEGGG